MSLYQKVTDLVLAQLSNGTVPWIRPWSASAGRNVPANAITGRPYSGINTLLLWSGVNHGFTIPRYLTFKQCKQLGARIIKGQNGFKIYFVKPIDVKTEDNDPKRITMLREYTVFNVAQCEGLPEAIANPQPAKVYNKGQRLELADEFVRSLETDIRYGGGTAYYAPGEDVVHLPRWESFRSPDAFYNTTFHELTHWTGHKSRLARDLNNRFGQQTYATEELIAELKTAFLTTEFGIDTSTQSTNYIESWIKLLHHDNRTIFTTASKTSKAADFLRSAALRSNKPCQSDTSFVPATSGEHPS